MKQNITFDVRLRALYSGLLFVSISLNIGLVITCKVANVCCRVCILRLSLEKSSSYSLHCMLLRRTNSLTFCWLAKIFCFFVVSVGFVI